PNDRSVSRHFHATILPWLLLSLYQPPAEHHAPHRTPDSASASGPPLRFATFSTCLTTHPVFPAAKWPSPSTHRCRLSNCTARFCRPHKTPSVANHRNAQRHKASPHRGDNADSANITCSAEAALSPQALTRRSLRPTPACPSLAKYRTSQPASETNRG